MTAAEKIEVTKDCLILNESSCELKDSRKTTTYAIKPSLPGAVDDNEEEGEEESEEESVSSSAKPTNEKLLREEPITPEVSKVNKKSLKSDSQNSTKQDDDSKNGSPNKDIPQKRKDKPPVPKGIVWDANKIDIKSKDQPTQPKNSQVINNQQIQNSKIQVNNNTKIANNTRAVNNTTIVNNVNVANNEKLPNNQKATDNPRMVNNPRAAGNPRATINPRAVNNPRAANNARVNSNNTGVASNRPMAKPPHPPLLENRSLRSKSGGKPTIKDAIEKIWFITINKKEKGKGEGEFSDDDDIYFLDELVMTQDDPERGTKWQKRRMFQAKETPNCFGKLFCDSFQTRIDYYMMDKRFGRRTMPLLSLERSSFCSCLCLFRPCMNIYYLEGKSKTYIGKSVEVYTCSGTEFEIYKEDDELKYIVKGDYYKGRCSSGKLSEDMFYSILDAKTEAQIGKITKKFVEGGDKVTIPNTYRIEFPKNSDWSDKSVLMSVALFVKYKFFTEELEVEYNSKYLIKEKEKEDEEEEEDDNKNGNGNEDEDGSYEDDDEEEKGGNNNGTVNKNKKPAQPQRKGSLDDIMADILKMQDSAADKKQILDALKID